MPTSSRVGARRAVELRAHEGYRRPHVRARAAEPHGGPDLRAPRRALTRSTRQPAPRQRGRARSSVTGLAPRAASKEHLMNNTRHTYLTTAIPFVNGNPHLGHALELVQADVLARHRRARGDAVRLLTGTDDNALKNVLAAEAAGVPVAEFVARNGDRFAALGGPLQVAPDDYIRTSTDPR